MKQWLYIVGLLTTCFTTFAATPWQKVTTPVKGTPNAIGEYSNGCIIGAKPLPLHHDGYQILKPQRLRYFGHPTLIHYISQLANQVHAQKIGTLLVGDMGMPAGGRFSSGHNSHQTGLDVDIWLQLPKQRWSAAKLRQPTAVDLVNGQGKKVVASRWDSHYTTLIRLAASDPKVTRIFVHPAIKQQLCQETVSQKEWLAKVRPWFGHRAHMHIRLACPPGSAQCVNQPLPPDGDGCGEELASWLRESKLPNANPNQPPPPPAPAMCQMLVESHFKSQ